jgi:hypothetical protein
MNTRYVIQQITKPDHVEVRDSQDRWLATLTYGAQTVTLDGPQRTFKESYKSADGSDKTVKVSHNVWVRCLPEPFDSAIDWLWLEAALAANASQELDILGIAMQYIKGAPPIIVDGRQIAGDAQYGPLTDSGDREEGADFSDYLGIEWTFPDRPGDPDEPEARQLHCLDCSGFIRMAWGFRQHSPNAAPLGAVPLSLNVLPGYLPRRAFQMCAGGPGVLRVPFQRHQITQLGELETGDLVFFKVDETDREEVDHVGMYLGVDTRGHYRFISSRKTANGPTLADTGGRSVLDGNGTFGKNFRAVRRL